MFEKRMIDGKEHMICKAEFNFGEIKQFRNKTVDGHRVVSMPMGIQTSMLIMKEAIRSAIKNDDYETFEERLEEYSRLYLNDVLGIESYPIQYNEEGKIEGIKRGEVIHE
jgi:hypothetical protein